MGLKTPNRSVDTNFVHEEPTSAGRELLNQRLGKRRGAIRLGGALVGLSTAYVASRILMVEVNGTGVVTVGRLLQELGLFLVFATAGLTMTTLRPVRRELRLIHRLVAQHEATLTERSRGLQFLRQVQSAFEMAEQEDELYEIAGRALRDASDHPGEILVADSSNAHIRRFVTADGHEAPGCGVTTPRGCPAVRSGQLQRFDSPNALGSCPRLRERGLDDDHLAVCVPVNVLGTSSAVLHAVRARGDSSVEELVAEASALEGVAIRFGSRLGLMRAMSQSQLQADTDPLTGLLNRRAMESRVRDMRTEFASFSVAMADLDHFKDLNDTFGHDTGDRALRLFARVLRSAVRDADIIARHGGEEFVIVLPGADVSRSAPVLHRLRHGLADALADAQLPAFTVSLGVVDSSAGGDLNDLIKLADTALMRAKAGGRDRVVIWDASLGVDAAAEATYAI